MNKLFVLTLSVFASFSTIAFSKPKITSKVKIEKKLFASKPVTNNSVDSTIKKEINVAVKEYFKQQNHGKNNNYKHHNDNNNSKHYSCHGNSMMRDQTSF